MKTNLPFALLCAALAVAGCGGATKPIAPTPIPPLSSLTLSPHADTLTVGDSRAFTATALDTLGQPYVGSLSWSSGDTGVFTVSPGGLVTARGEGAATLRVSGGGRSDSALVVVFPAAGGWVAQTSNASEDLQGVFFDPGGRLGWAVGSGGVVLSTADAGVTWTRRTPTTFDLRGVWFTSAAEGWAVGLAGTVLHTLNGGGSWTRLTNTGTSEELHGVWFASRDTGWVVGGNGFTMATTDRGASWSRVYIGGRTLNAVRFAGANGWAVGEGGVVAGSHDGGATWFVVQPSVTTQALRGLWRLDADRAVAVGLQGAVARSLAGPDSVGWTLANAGASYQLESVCFPSAAAGFAAGWNGSGGVVLRSDDAGANWMPQVVASQFKLKAVHFVDDRRGWAVGENGTIRHTATGGE